VAGHKIIQPLDADDAATPDIEKLLAVEDAKDAATAAPQVVVSDAAPAAEAPKEPAVDPNTIAL
jgi:hypothetical protein